jgi:hypothetical protein
MVILPIPHSNKPSKTNKKQDLILKPYRVATSKPAQKTYLNTLLFLVTSSVLLCLAVIAYILFYLNYVPQIGIERVIHLQYGYASSIPPKTQGEKRREQS